MSVDKVLELMMTMRLEDRKRENDREDRRERERIEQREKEEKKGGIARDNGSKAAYNSERVPTHSPTTCQH